MKPAKMSAAEAAEQLGRVRGWQIEPNGKVLVKSFELKDFLAAIDLIRQIAVLAETMDHHPDLHLERYRWLRVELSTHATDGLTALDFELAEKIERLPKKLGVLKNPEGRRR